MTGPKPANVRGHRTSGSARNVGLVIGLPVGASDFGVDGEAAFGSGAGVAPADVSGDGVALLVVAAVIGAVERVVAQGSELGLDPVQPRRVGRDEHQLDVVGV